MQPRTKTRPRSTPARRPRARRSPLAVAALIALTCAVVTGALVGLGRCAAAPEGGPVGAEPYVSPYDWTLLQRDGDRLAYVENGEARSQVGVDVSEHQGAIDWQAAAADGIGFAFVRVGNRGYTEGALYADARYAENLDGASAAGLEVGAYFFSQATNEQEAREEADFVVELLAGRRLELPVVFDHEPVSDANGRANSLDRQTLTACAAAFCERLEAAGYQTMVYGNKGDMARYDRAALGERPVWFAEYDAAAPSAQFDFAYWQYTNAGRVAGIPTAVDLNLRLPELP
ncbi:MAG TPA: glycoside hydrolase family 25 protein [Candidatus Rubneribacter avistercoris]|nr:glycoside hydrolase family 25 protein [Candidatus Rubneribacter avistercoris]